MTIKIQSKNKLVSHSREADQASRESVTIGVEVENQKRM